MKFFFAAAGSQLLFVTNKKSFWHFYSTYILPNGYSIKYLFNLIRYWNRNAIIY